MNNISVVIVTHNSKGVIGRCLNALARQSLGACEIIVVDSGSDDSSYLRQYEPEAISRLILLDENIGFARANNLGYACCRPENEFVLFLNPDAFPRKTALARSVRCLGQHEEGAVVGGRLLGWDMTAGRQTGLLDSTGIFRKSHGRWYDRGQGEPDTGQYPSLERVPAVCGAYMFCRKKALDAASVSSGQVFDPDFFLYKEDIELCLRLRRNGFSLFYDPDIEVYHCRGWQGRRRMPAGLRLRAAASELLLYRKHPSVYILWAMAKYLAVRFLRL